MTGTGDLSSTDMGTNALLAGLPNAPSAYNPKANPELAVQRQQQVLRRMVDCDIFLNLKVKIKAAFIF